MIQERWELPQTGRLKTALHPTTRMHLPSMSSKTFGRLMGHLSWIGNQRSQPAHHWCAIAPPASPSLPRSSRLLFPPQRLLPTLSASSYPLNGPQSYLQRPLSQTPARAIIPPRLPSSPPIPPSYSHGDILHQGVALWNEWRAANPDICPNLRGVYLNQAHLRGADLHSADLCCAFLYRADLRGADLSGADLGGADLTRADLEGACLWRASLGGACLSYANLMEVDLGEADLRGVVWPGAILQGASFEGTIFNDFPAFTLPQHPDSAFSPSGSTPLVQPLLVQPLWY